MSNDKPNTMPAEESHGPHPGAGIQQQVQCVDCDHWFWEHLDGLRDQDGQFHCKSDAARLISEAKTAEDRPEEKVREPGDIIDTNATAVLRFNIPEEKDQLLLALHGVDFFGALHRSNEVIRRMIKENNSDNEYTKGLHTALQIMIDEMELRKVSLDIVD